MMDKVEMSLDDIIKQSKDLRRGGARRGRGGGIRRGGTGGVTRINARGGVGPIRNRRGGRISSQRTPFSRSPGDINSRWQHDMYDGPAFNRRRNSGMIGGSSAGGSAKIVVSNLDFGVSNSDIQELFSEFGPIKSAMVNYDKSGRSNGSANVVFERRADAIKALKQYNNVPLDGRPMKIELTTSDTSVFLQARRLSGGFNSGDQQRTGRGGARGGRGFTGGFRRGGARGGGRGRGAKTPAPTAAELDAELDAYVNRVK